MQRALWSASNESLEVKTYHQISVLKNSLTVSDKLPASLAMKMKQFPRLKDEASRSSVHRPLNKDASLKRDKLVFAKPVPAFELGLPN